MATYQRLIEQVSERAGRGTTERAKSAVEQVVAAIACRLDRDDRARLRSTLPTLLHDSTEPVEPSSEVAASGVVRDVAHRGGYTYERARYVTEAVVEALLRTDEELVNTLGQRLPELNPLRPPSEADAGWRRDTAMDRPNRLTIEEINRALGDLIGWSGDTRGLTRTVVLPADRMPTVHNRIRQAERQVNHPAHLEQTGDQLIVTVTTRSLDAVTDLDIELARRIDEAIAAVGSGG